jgi:hypothetical protein
MQDYATADNTATTTTAAATATVHCSLQARLAQCLEPMKDSFIVAKLHPPRFIEECAERCRREARANTEAAQQGLDPPVHVR